jgi:hypothetical protein
MTSDGKGFNLDRFEVLPVAGHEQGAMSFLSQRGLRRETVDFFAPHIHLVKDKEREGMSFYNLGFPYTVAGKDKVEGYEIRGYGSFKSKAPGTNSSTGAWIVSKAVSPADVRNVYFAESSFDIMAFYQANRFQLDTSNAAFVSLGGTFSNGQVSVVMKHFSSARAIDCFDNDLAGRMAGLRMAALLEGFPIGMFRTGNDVKLVAGGKSATLKPDEVSMAALGKLVRLKGLVGTWKPAARFKDWNDQILNRPVTVVSEPTKFDRDRHLAESRGRTR